MIKICEICKLSLWVKGEIMFEVKEFMDTCNNEEFYKYMGRFFAERIFRKELPYLINDQEKIWYLFFDHDVLAGFCGVVMSQNSTSFTDFYLLPTYRNQENKEFMAKYMLNLYHTEKIRILTNSEDEMNLWEELGFMKGSMKGSYTTYVYGEELCE